MRPQVDTLNGSSKMPLIKPVSEIQNTPICLGMFVYDALATRGVIVGITVSMIIHVALWLRVCRR